MVLDKSRTVNLVLPILSLDSAEIEVTEIAVSIREEKIRWSLLVHHCRISLEIKHIELLGKLLEAGVSAVLDAA